MRKRRKQTSKDVGYKPVSLQARGENQRKYIRSIHSNEITFCTGPAGSGKTHVAIGMAVQLVQQEKLDRIIITRPLVSVGKDMGFLPGDMMAKVGPYVVPCFDELNYYLSLSMISSWQREGRIEVVPLFTMRGRTFNNAFIVLDEAQNATHAEVKTCLTRLGDPSRLVIIGDLDQSDLPRSGQGAFAEAVKKLHDLEGIGHVTLREEDIVRHHLIGDIIKRLW